MKYPQQAKGPFMMAPGSKEVDSPGPFRDDSKAVMFYGKQTKMKRPMNVKPDFPDVDGDGDKKEPISKAQKDLQAQKKPQMGHSKPQMGHSKPQMGHSKPQMSGMMKPRDYHK